MEVQSPKHVTKVADCNEITAVTDTSGKKRGSRAVLFMN